MHRAWKIITCPITTLRTATFTASLIASILLPMLSKPSIARADSVVQYGSAWLNGGGVDIMSGGDGTYSCVSVTGAPGQSQCSNQAGKVYAGDKWQCVEMVNRLYLSKGWTTSTWWGNGSSIINDLPNHPGLTDQLQDHISYVNPGDVVTETHSTDGHAGVINSVDANGTIHIKSQNADLDSQASITSGSLAAGTAHYALSGWIGYSVQAIIHAPSTPSGGSPQTASKVSSVQYQNEMDVYTVGGDNNLWKDTWNGSSWGGFSSQGGGNLTGTPASVVYGTEMDVYTMGTDGNVYKRTWNGSSWGGFDSLGGGSLTGSPTAIVYGSEMDVYARGTNGQVYKDTWNGSSWGGFSSLGGSLVGNPYALQYGSEMDVLARGSDNSIQKDTWNGSSWGGFSSLGGNLSSDPTGIAYNNEFDVYANSYGAIYKDTWNGSSWGGFSSLGGNLGGDPTALQYNTEMDVYAQDPNGKTQKDTWNGSSWGGFSQL